MPTPDLVTPELLRDWKLPDPEGSKHSRGEVLIVGGAAGTPGGVALAGLAGLRVGAGRVRLGVAASVAAAMAVAFPEAGVVGLPESEHGTVLGGPAARVLGESLGSADCVLVGPGLDDIGETSSLLEQLLSGDVGDASLVLDAYALGALSDSEQACALVTDSEARIVLTPNAAELGVLLGEEDADAEAVPRAASRYRCCVASQGVVATDDGRVWRVPQGHSGLATAGSGDVLAGLIAGLLARGADPSQAACWGTYLHSTAGERLSSAIGGIGFLARELVDQVPPVLAELT